MITRLNRGGPATNVAIASRGLESRGFRTLVVHGSLHTGEAAVSAEAFQGIDSVQVPELIRSIHPALDVRALVKILAIVRNFRPHLIHTHLSKAGLIGRMVACVKPRIPTVHTYHGIVASQFFSGSAAHAVLGLERFLARQTSALVAISQQQRDELLGLGIGRPDQVHVLELAIDTSSFRSARARGRAAARRQCGIPMDEVAIIYSGRLTAVKRVDWLISAAVPILTQNPKAALYVVGDGEERSSLENWVRSAGIDRVHFVGWGKSIADWYAAADVVALGSRWEGTPLAVIEAMATGRPVVSTDVGGVRDIVSDGINGIIVPINDQRAMTVAFSHMTSDEHLRNRMGSAALVVAQRFSAERFVDQLDRLYRNLIFDRRF